MAHTAPLFVFLATHDAAQSLDTEAESFLAFIDCDGTALCVDAEQVVDGAVLDNDETPTEGVLDRIGHRDLIEFQMDLDGKIFGEAVVEVANTVASSFAHPDTPAMSRPSPAPNQFDVYSGNGIARTRDAAIWVGSMEQGFAPPVRMGGGAADRRVARPDAALLGAALRMAHATLPEGTTFEEVVEGFLVGVIPRTSSMHATLAQRARVLEDLAHFAALWGRAGQPARAVVPVFL